MLDYTAVIIIIILNLCVSQLNVLIHLFIFLSVSLFVVILVVT